MTATQVIAGRPPESILPLLASIRERQRGRAEWEWQRKPGESAEMCRGRIWLDRLIRNAS